MSLNKRLIKSNEGSSLGPNPSDISTVQSTTIAGGTYRFVDMYMDKANGDKVYYIRNGGFNYNSIAIATMSTAFDLSTLSLSATSTNWQIGYYAVRIHGQRDGGKLITSGYENSDSNRYITEYYPTSNWAAPSSYSNVTSRINGTGGCVLLHFSDSGDALYYDSGTQLLQYSLSSPFATSTQSYVQSKDFNSISADTITLSGAGWRIINGDWFVNGLTYYLLMYYYNGSTTTAYKIKAYDTTVPFDIGYLAERGNSTDYTVTQFSTGGGLGFSVSDFGHFLIGEQDINNGSQEWWLLQ